MRLNEKCPRGQANIDRIIQQASLNKYATRVYVYYLRAFRICKPTDAMIQWNIASQLFAGRSSTSTLSRLMILFLNHKEITKKQVQSATQSARDEDLQNCGQKILPASRQKGLLRIFEIYYFCICARKDGLSTVCIGLNSAAISATQHFQQAKHFQKIITRAALSMYIQIIKTYKLAYIVHASSTFRSKQLLQTNTI